MTTLELNEEELYALQRKIEDAVDAWEQDVDEWQEV